MGHLAITVTGWVHGEGQCAECGQPSFKVTASGPNEVFVTLIERHGNVQANGTFTPKQLYELATLSAQVLVAQSEAMNASQS